MSYSTKKSGFSACIEKTQFHSTIIYSRVFSCIEEFIVLFYHNKFLVFSLVCKSLYGAKVVKA